MKNVKTSGSRSAIAKAFLLPLSFLALVANGRQLKSASVTPIIQKANTAGASVRVIKNEQVVFSLNYGSANLENHVPVSDQTQFGIMSLTKTFVACGIMQLAEAHKLNLSDAVTPYVKGLPAAYRQVTIQELLSHTSGVPDYVHTEGYMQTTQRTASPMELLTPGFSRGLDFEPGTKSTYSNSNYILLGMIIERLSNASLARYLKSAIFGPLEMKDTYLEELNSNNRGKAQGYLARGDGFDVEKALNPTQYWAAGGIVTTGNDLSAFDIALAQGKLLPVAVVQKMMRPAKLKDSTDTDYGLGFELMRGGDLQLCGATGVGVGYNAANIHFSNTGATIIVLTNTTNGKSGLIANQVNDLMAAPPQPPAASAQKDSLDEITSSIIRKAVAGRVDTGDFASSDAAEKFRAMVPFIQSQGKLSAIENKGQKVNPGSTVRRYLITFEKGETMWVFIFSKNQKVAVINHM